MSGTTYSKILNSMRLESVDNCRWHMIVLAGDQSPAGGAVLRTGRRRHLPDVAHIELVDDGNKMSSIDQPDRRLITGLLTALG